MPHVHLVLQLNLGLPPWSTMCSHFMVKTLCFECFAQVTSVVGEADGILELLQNEIGVDVKVTDPVLGSNEQIIIISSEEVLVISLSL
jgi:hypothetical protein